MNGRQWRKLFAGGGVIAMLLGVLMVVAPTSAGAAPPPEFVAGNPGCDQITGEYEIEAKDDSGLQEGGSGTATATDVLGNELTVNYWIDADGTVRFEVADSSDYLVSAVLIKQGNYEGTNTAAVYYYDPPVTGDSGLTIYADQGDDDELSHITFCGSTGSLSVEKIVSGSDAPSDDPDYSFTLTCTNNDNEITLQGDDSTFALADGESKSVPDEDTEVGIPLSSDCTLTEIGTNDATKTTFTVGETTTEGDSLSGIEITDTPTHVVVENHFEAADLEIVKLVDGETPSSEPFSFDVEPGGDDVDFDLSHGESSDVDVAVGTEYTVTEDAETGFTLTDVTCYEGYDPESTENTEFDSESWTESSTGVAITLADGDDVTCVFTNTPDEAPSADLEIVKLVDGETPSSEPFSFDVEPGGDDVDFDLSHGESSDVDVAVGTEYTVTEDAETGFTLTDVTCYEGYDPESTENTEFDSESWTESSTGVAITLADGDDVTCVFTNTPVSVGGDGFTPTYSLDIVKTNNADQDTTFSNAEFANGDDQDVTFQIVISNTGTGNVTVNSVVDTFSGERVNLLTDDVSLDCDSGFPASLVIEVGEDVTCTFVIEGYSVAGSSIVNTVTVDTEQTGPDSDTSQVITPEVAQEATGSITVVKDMDGDPLEDWQAEIDTTGTGVDDVTLTNDDDTESWFGLGAGSYTLTEDVAALDDDVAFESLACEDSAGAAVGTVDEASVSIDLAAGQDVVCTFVNTYTEPAVAPVVQPVVQPQAPAVLGDVVTRPRALPRTGSEASGLAAAGAGLLAIGVAMVLSSRMRFRRVS